MIREASTTLPYNLKTLEGATPSLGTMKSVTGCQPSAVGTLKGTGSHLP